MFDKQLPVFSISVNGKQEVIDPNEDLKIYEAELKQEFSEQPSKFAFYGGLHGDALVSLESYKNTLKKFEADNEAVMRDRIITRYGDKERITEAKMEAEFARDENWQNVKKAILEQERFVNRLEVIRDAFKQRSQMLWQLGATARAEMLPLRAPEGSESEN